MLKVSGKYIVDETGKKVVLKGYNVGNWMMMENFMLGYPGTEEEFRKAVRKYAGEEKYEYFFNQYYKYFLGEKDIEFMRKMGMNCIRVPFNYRHFEDDNHPYTYKEKGFELLDQLISICKKHHMYIILDMHAVQGGQSICWHCDNNGKHPRIYTHADERKRYYKLWRAIAKRYRDEDIIAAYDLMNEPDALEEEEDMLNQIFREVVEEVRAVDKNHILFIAGNVYNTKFDKLEAPFAENLAYTCHYYLACCTSTPMDYPGKLDGMTYDRALIEHEMDSLDAYMREHEVPCWIGEFGVRLSYPGYTEDRLKAFADQLDCICRRDHHYSIWSYKDIGYLSTVTVKPDSPWLKFTEKIRELKERYYVDMNFRVNEDWGLSELLQLKDKEGFADRYGTVKEAVATGMKHVIASELAHMLGKQFAELSMEELDELAASFAFENCFVDDRRVELIQKFGKPEFED